jgi:subtilisin-like proprotein convertase family protein
MPYIVTATNGNCTEVDTVNIMVNNFIPSAPVAVNPLVNICAGVTSQNVAVTPSISAPGVMTTSRTALTKAISNDLIDTKDTLTVGTLPSGSTVTGLSVGINITHTWNSDMNIYLIAPNGTEIELSTGNGGDGDNYTNTIFSTNATAVITSGASPFTGSFLPEGNLGQFLNGTNGQWILKIVDNGFGDDGVLISWSVNVQYSLPAATVWYQTPTSTTSIGTTASIEAIGTPVMSAPAALGTYTFYAAAQDNVPGGCFSATRTPITVNVVSVIAEILPINATCNSVANGSFSLGTISCGATPFTYSVDGGAFGAIPTNLAYGSHTVVVKDATGALAPSVSIFIDQPTWITNVPNFVANGWACKDATSEVISAANPNLSPTDNILIQSNVSVPALVSWTTPGNYTTTFNLNLPVGANVTSATLLVNGLTTTGLTYASDLDFNVSGLGSLSVTPNVSDMVNNLNLSYALTSLNSSSNSVTISIDHYYTGTATIANLSLVVSYTINQTLDNITWYAAPTGGTSIGSGFTLESVGTPVLPNTITPGTYNFYAQGELDGCSSFTRRLVPVTIQAPTVVANIQTATVCPGQFLILNATGGLTYTWSNGAGQNTPFVPAPTAYVGGTQSYVVNGLDIDGCANQDTVVVTVLPQPILNAGVDQAVCVGIPVILNAGTTLQTATPVTGIVWSNAIPNNTQYVPTTSGILTATATGANGCTTQDSVQITVLALPVVNAGQDVTVCAGLSTTLNASGASSYAWNNGVSQGQPFYPNATQTYTVVGTGSNGCTNTDQLIVTVSTGPTVNLSAPQTVCANVPASLSAAVQNSLGGIWTTTNGTGVISPNVTNGTVNYTPSVNDPAVVNLTYVATNACGSASQNTTVTVLPIPVVNAGLDFAVCQGTSATLTATGTGFLTWTTPNVTNGIAFVPTATANYNVVATAANNCTNSDQVTVTVLPLPDVDAGANQTICSGESVTLNGEGAVSYQWTGGASNNVSFAPTTTATYTVTGTGINGCVSSDQVTVVVNATPVATISVVNDITLAASPAGMNYTWINCASGTDVPNGSTANFTAIANGSYAVIVTSAEGCADQSGCEIISSVGLDQIANIEMSVQPNPTAGELTINMPASLKATAQVFDAQGKLVQTESNVENGTVLHLESMTTGVYMVRITADNTVQTFRVVKQ